MTAEYFPPKEDVILQNEAPTDFYILATGAVVYTYTYTAFSTQYSSMLIIYSNLMM